MPSDSDSAPWNSAYSAPSTQTIAWSSKKLAKQGKHCLATVNRERKTWAKQEKPWETTTFAGSKERKRRRVSKAVEKAHEVFYVDSDDDWNKESDDDDDSN